MLCDEALGQSLMILTEVIDLDLTINLTLASADIRGIPGSGSFKRWKLFFTYIPLNRIVFVIISRANGKVFVSVNEVFENVLNAESLETILSYKSCSLSFKRGEQTAQT